MGRYLKSIFDDEGGFSLPKEMSNAAKMALLDNKIIQLDGQVDENMAEYVRKGTMYLSTSVSPGQTPPELSVYITSQGGYITAGMEIHDRLLMYGPVKGIVVGYAYSAAAMLILQGCSMRLATENSRIMCHNTLALDVLTRRNLTSKGWHQRILREFDIDEAAIRKILMDRTGQSEQIIRKLLIREQFLTAHEALEFGLIDGILKFGFKREEHTKAKGKRTRRTKDKNAS